MTDKLVERDSIKEQLGRLGMDVIFPEEKTPKGEKVKATKQEKPKKQVKTSKTFTKAKQVKPRPQKQRVQKSASPSGASFFNFVEGVAKKVKNAVD